jgi:6-hydroxymethylpterin diphosphokinase MptE-like protein
MGRVTGLAKSALMRTVGEPATTAIAYRIADWTSGVSYRLDERGRRSSRRLDELKDRHAGERCVIIGNGPSLKAMDLTPLRHEYTFGLNRAPMLFSRLGFETSFLVSVNPHVVAQSGAEILATSCQKFVSWRARDPLPRTADVTYLRTLASQRVFSTDPARGLWEGATVTFVAMQLAYHFGFERVVLIGVDHSFSAQGPANALITSHGSDADHFDPAYFGPGYRWQLPDLPMSEVAYELARRQFERSGRQIVDATVGGKLTIFPKVAYAQELGAGRDPS